MNAHAFWIALQDASVWLLAVLIVSGGLLIWFALIWRWMPSLGWLEQPPARDRAHLDFAINASELPRKLRGRDA